MEKDLQVDVRIVIGNADDLDENTPTIVYSDLPWPDAVELLRMSLLQGFDAIMIQAKEG